MEALTGNHILDSLPNEEFRHLSEHLEDVPLTLRDSLFPQDREGGIYFPTEGIVSTMHVLSDGRMSEVAIVGREGVIGTSVFIGGSEPLSTLTVQGAGRALRLASSIGMEAFARGGVLQALVLGYLQVLLSQMGQTAVCNRHHTVEQQLCRWLLMTHDRIDGDEIIMTHGLISEMLGVRREGVTLAARKLQSQGIIRYSRGHIHVLDANLLRQRSCECYQTMQRALARYLQYEPHLSLEVRRPQRPVPARSSAGSTPVDSLKAERR